MEADACASVVRWFEGELVAIRDGATAKLGSSVDSSWREDECRIILKQRKALAAYMLEAANHEK